MSNMWSDNSLNFSANICRLCANSCEIVIPIFGKEGDKERVDLKIRKCLPIIVREDDCKPKQVCLTCASKLEMCADLVEMCLAAEFKFESILHARFPGLKSVEQNSVPAQDNGDVNKPAGVVDTLPVLSMRTSRNWSDELAKGDSASSSTMTVQHDGGVIVLGKVDGESREDCQDFVLMVELKYKDPLDTSQAAYTLEPQDGSMGKVHSGVYVPESEKLQAVTYTSEIHAIGGGKTLTYTIDGEANPSLKSFALTNPSDSLVECQEKTQTLIYATQTDQLITSKTGEFELAAQQQGSLEKTDSASASFADNAHAVEYTTVQQDPHAGKLQQLLAYTTVQQAATPVVVTRTQVLPKTLSEVIEEANISAKEIVFSAKDNAALESLENGALLLSTNKLKSNTPGNNTVTSDKPKKPFPCSVCTKSFMRRSNLNAHMVTHTQVRPHVCEECGKQFCVRWDLTLHQRIHTGLFSCEYCSKAFTVHAKLKRHIRTHTGERPYSCSTCGRAFNDKRNLKSHQRTHTGERPYSCTTCGRSFRVRSHMLDHHRVHTQEAPFTCDICGKSFKWKTNLNIHLKVHSGEHFVCSECGREFTRHSELMKHRRVHTGVRAHVCDICNKSFCERNMLQKHMKLHIDQKPYSCDVCGKSFHYNWYLISHKKMHAEEKTGNTCEHCGKVFSKKGNLAAHSKCCQTSDQPVTVE